MYDKELLTKKNHFILDKNKNVIPATLLECGEFLETARQERIVKQEELNGYEISTVFLGIDHQFGIGPPLIFETMVFVKDDRQDIYCDRYSTWKEAEQGHKKAVEWVENGCSRKDHKDE
jgi:hypothetical protein